VSQRPLFLAAQICENGHVVNSTLDIYELDNSSELTEDHCSKCGVKTITQCPQCKDALRGKSRTMCLAPAIFVQPTARNVVVPIPGPKQR